MNQLREMSNEATRKAPPERWYESLFGLFLFIWIFYGVPGGWILALAIPYGQTNWPAEPMLKPLVPVLYGISWIAAILVLSHSADQSPMAIETPVPKKENIHIQTPSAHLGFFDIGSVGPY